MIKTRYWIIAIALLTIILAIIAFFTLNQHLDTPTAEIYVDGECVRSVDLNEADDYTFEIKTQYGKNIIHVKNGQICVEEADCPDRVCVDYG